MFKKILIFLAVIFSLLCGCSAVESNIENETKNIEIQTGKIGGQTAVSRCIAAKMTALAFNKKSDIELMETVIKFDDVQQDSWYFKYINAVYSQGYMMGTDEGFKPLEPLTLNEAQTLLIKLNPANKKRFKITDETKNNPVSYSLWIELFFNALKEGEKDINKDYNIEENEAIVFATPSNGNMPSWTIATDIGELGFSGFNMDMYIDKKLKFLIKDNEILAAVEVMDIKPVITNAYIKECTQENITIFSYGASREISCKNGRILNNCIADIKLNNGEAEILKTIDEIVIGTIKKVGDGKIELEQEGILKASNDIKMYGISDNIITVKHANDLICGTDIADFYMDDGEVTAAVIRRTITPENIRVVLNTTGYSGLIHENVQLSSTEDFKINETPYKKEEVVNITKENASEFFSNSNRIYVKSETGKIQINSIKRGSDKTITPKYYGTIEIEKTDNGFIIVNDVNIEKYLYSVIPSEMPSSYGIEAAKVQAVTARSYAYNQFFANKYCNYGGNIEDSILSQVYNNTEENDISIQAVDQTNGYCLTVDNTVISANFFSTSAGITANSGEVWATDGGKTFPSETKPYLKSVKQYKDGDFGVLSDEENAAKFFKAKDIDAFDKEFSWFRWSLTMATDELSATVNNNIKTAYENNPFLVKTLQSDGTYKSMPIENIGTFTDITVLKRGEGGNIMELVLKGTDAQVMLSTEYIIRTVLKPKQYISERNPINITLNNNSVVSNYNIMPSAFFTFDKIKDDAGNITAIKFFGGGNGHGVGMSQNGVKGMIDKGYKFDEIIKHFYSNSEVKKVI